MWVFITKRKDFFTMPKNLKNDKALTVSDEKIIELYWNREEKAIEETDRKYGNYLHTIAYNILHNDLDCEECLNDTYLGTWNSIPPSKPSALQVFISKIMRNISISRYQKNRAAKRVPSEMTVSMDELEKYIVYNEFESPTEQEYYTYQLSRLLSEYLRSLSDKQRFIFICRYYCSDSISSIGEMLHISDRTVFRELSALKASLKELLIKEGYYDEK